MRSAGWALAAAAGVTASCGGGGGGGEGSVGGGSGSSGGKALYVTLTFPNDALSLYKQVSIQPQLGGFEGHAANCSLVG